MLRFGVSVNKANKSEQASNASAVLMLCQGQRNCRCGVVGPVQEEDEA